MSDEKRLSHQPPPLFICCFVVVATVYCIHGLFSCLHLLLGDSATQTSQPYDSTLVLSRTFIYQVAGSNNVAKINATFIKSPAPQIC